MAIQQVMSARSGHDTHVYDKSDVVDLAEAKARFDALVKVDQCLAARQNADGSHTQLRTFDPEADKTVFVTPRIGG